MENTKWVEFDCLEASWALAGIYRCLAAANLSDKERDTLVIVILPFGPAGGNPCIKLAGMSEPTAKIVRAWLANNSLSWHDETGTLHDWTSTHDEKGWRVSGPCCDVAVGLDPDCFCDK